MSSRNRKLRRQSASSATRAEHYASAHTVHTTTSFAGPLPPPSVLADYERAQPGLAADIVTMMKEEQRHRHSCVSEEQAQRRYVIEAQTKHTWAGMALCFVVFAMLFVASIYLETNGHTGQSVAALIAAFSLLVSGLIKIGRAHV